MSAFQTFAALLTLTAAFAYVNHRWIHQAASIALMALTLGLSLALVGLDRLGVVSMHPLTEVLERVDLDETLLHGMLGTLLFAGALHIRIDDLREEKAAISILAIAGTLISTFVVAVLAYAALPVLGLSVDFRNCMLFGAIVSPTDPIAVLGILKQARVPRSMEIQIGGESLFNDGVGVVIFTTVVGTMTHGKANPGDAALLFAREALGGGLFGFVSGHIVYRLLRSIDHYQTELLLTIALVLGGYSLAERLHVSAPIAAVVAGLVIGNHGREHGMSEGTRDHIDKFWSLMDEILNAVLFVLVGFEVIRLTLTKYYVAAAVTMIPVVLLARFISVALPVSLLARRTRFAPGTVAVLTWGGLRGGISVALALSSPGGANKDLIVTMTYFVVTFSILIQGLTLGRFVRRFAGSTLQSSRA